MTTVIIDMSDQPAGAFFGESTDWTFECEFEQIESVLSALKTLGIPARVEWTVWQGEFDASEFPENAIVATHPSEAGHLLVTESNGL